MTQEGEKTNQNGITFVYLGYGNYAKLYEKDGSFPTGKTFYYRKCKCGQLVSNCGFAQQHKCKALK